MFVYPVTRVTDINFQQNFVSCKIALIMTYPAVDKSVDWEFCFDFPKETVAYVQMSVDLFTPVKLLSLNEKCTKVFYDI